MENNPMTQRDERDPATPRTEPVIPFDPDDDPAIRPSRHPASPGTDDGVLGGGPSGPEGGALVMGGSTADDPIRIHPTDATGLQRVLAWLQQNHGTSLHVHFDPSAQSIDPAQPLDPTEEVTRVPQAGDGGAAQP